MASSYCTVYVGNLPENVTSKQLGERFNHAFKDMKVVHSEVVNKAGKPYGFVVYPLSGDSTPGEQYLEKERMLVFQAVNISKEINAELLINKIFVERNFFLMQNNIFATISLIIISIILTLLIIKARGENA